MSEYRYYEFQAVDRPLTDKETKQLRRVSSRAQITATGFTNVYNWGYFKGNTEKWMEHFFDAFLYVDNSGGRMLMLRLPHRLLPMKEASRYCGGSCVGARRAGDHLILSFNSDEEDHEWAYGESWLPSLISLRADLMQGDLRSLYLGWLLAAQWGELDDDVPEPAVPPGLNDPDDRLVRFIEFLRIDKDLVAAAAERSGTSADARLSQGAAAKWAKGLPARRKDRIIVQLLEGETRHLGAELRRQARTELAAAAHAHSGGKRRRPRSVGELLARAKAVGRSRRKHEAESRAREQALRERKKAAARKKYLESLCGQENELWQKVRKLIATRLPQSYDEAVGLLEDLRDLAGLNRESSKFRRRMNALSTRHKRKSTLMKRLRDAALIGP
ncbi:MAG: hypothetical protein ABIJ56_02240 [Pseudomonadota bacterium]